MSQDKDKDSNDRVGTRASLIGRMTIPILAVLAITLSLYFFNTSNTPAPANSVTAAVPQPVDTDSAVASGPMPESVPPATVNQDSIVAMDIDTELGPLRAEFYADKAPVVVADLINLIHSGYFESDTVLESRPGLGFVISKMGNSANEYHVEDVLTGLPSQRGSIAISKSAVSGAYLNNLFFGYHPQPDLEQHYIIIGQVTEGLERFERAAPGRRYSVSGFKLEEQTRQPPNIAASKD